MKKKRWILFGIILAAAAAWNIYWNSTITVHTYVHRDKNLPKELSGCRIVQLTDVHSVRTKEQGRLIYEKTVAEEPDLICITGDLVDSRYYSEHGVEGEKLTLELVRKLVQLAPVYFVYGNHEMILLDDPIRNAFKVALEEMGVHIINNEVERWHPEEGSGEICIAGIQDPSTLYKDPKYAYYDTNPERMEAMMEDVMSCVDEGEFVLLLSHRPEYMELYDQYSVNLCLSGHAHGGQFRIPFIGGVYAPGQGFLPKYTVGVYESEDLSMYVGTGVGNSVIPVRVFNPPELLTIVLERTER